MISVVITNYRTDPEMQEILRNCMASFMDRCDELIVISSKKSSLAQKINQGFKMSKGDFIVITNDDVRLLTDLHQLAKEDGVTSPCINGHNKGFSGHIFCVPRWVYEKTGGYSEDYEHAYYDDDDFAERLKYNNIPSYCVPEVDVFHPPHGATTLGTIEGDFNNKNREIFRQKWQK